MKNRSSTIILCIVLFGVFVAASGVNWDLRTVKLTATGTTTLAGATTISGATTLSGGATLSGANVLSGTNTLSGVTTISGDCTMSRTVIITSTTLISAATSLSGATTLSGDATFTGEVINTFDAEEITSPTLTIDATDLYFVTLNSDENTTGVTITNGTVGQVIVFVTGAGSNTIRFDDDGINMALGANITLTEGQSDSLTLVMNAAGDWACIAAHDN